MLRNRWPGTVDTVSLDDHCQFILEAPAKPIVLLASLSKKTKKKPTTRIWVTESWSFVFLACWRAELQFVQ